MTTERSDYKQKILTALAEYKFLSSKQVWDKTGAALEGKSFNQTQVELTKLKNAGLIRREVVRGVKGNASLHQWVLARPGARLINFEKYGRHFERPISRYQAEIHKLEIDLEEQIGLAQGGWKLVKSFKSSSTNRLPKTTEQYDWLCKVMTFKEYQRTGQLSTDYYGDHTLMVPLRANHHLAYLPSCHAAVVFILPHPRATDKFWEEREKEYRGIREVIPILGVFPNKEKLQASKRALDKFELRGISIGQVSGLLTRILN